MKIANKQVKEITVEIPEGHKHLRTTIALKDDREFTFQEATIAGLARAFITVKTHPRASRAHLKIERLGKRKPGYDEWQLLEVENEE